MAGKVSGEPSVACTTISSMKNSAPDRGHQGGEVVVDRDEPEADHVHDEADEPRGEGRDQEHQRGRSADEGERGQTHVRPGQRRRGVGHVELAHGAEDQCEADPDQRIGGAEQQAVADGLGDLDELEPEVIHHATSLAPGLRKYTRTPPGRQRAESDRPTRCPCPRALGEAAPVWRIGEPGPFVKLARAPVTARAGDTCARLRLRPTRHEPGCGMDPGSAGVPPASTMVGLRPTAGGTPALPGDASRHSRPQTRRSRRLELV